MELLTCPSGNPAQEVIDLPLEEPEVIDFDLEVCSFHSRTRRPSLRLHTGTRRKKAVSWADGERSWRSCSMDPRREAHTAEQSQIQQIAKCVDKHRATLSELRNVASSSLAEGVPRRRCYQQLQEAVNLLSQSQKRARNLHEDLLQTLLTLDKLVGLMPEDRASRKTVIALIEELLDGLEVVTTTLDAIGAVWKEKLRGMSGAKAEYAEMDTQSSEDWRRGCVGRECRDSDLGFSTDSPTHTSARRVATPMNSRHSRSSSLGPRAGTSSLRLQARPTHAALALSIGKTHAEEERDSLECGDIVWIKCS
mmetsp:Transcript_11747/g.21910  ORF Transcript_11747/g.21910 Transcript_11747/m.21910 type:complete len:308 (+) Transcript_11747:106-1029(+)